MANQLSKMAKNMAGGPRVAIIGRFHCSKVDWWEESKNKTKG